jgi:hypothetical protein
MKRKTYGSCYPECGGEFLFQRKTERRKDDRKRDQKVYPGATRRPCRIRVKCEKCGRVVFAQGIYERLKK